MYTAVGVILHKQVVSQKLWLRDLGLSKYVQTHNAIPCAIL